MCDSTGCLRHRCLGILRCAPRHTYSYSSLLCFSDNTKKQRTTRIGMTKVWRSQPVFKSPAGSKAANYKNKFCCAAAFLALLLGVGQLSTLATPPCCGASSRRCPRTRADQRFEESREWGAGRPKVRRTHRRECKKSSSIVVLTHPQRVRSSNLRREDPAAHPASTL